MMSESSAAASALQLSAVHKRRFFHEVGSEADSPVIPKALCCLGRAPQLQPSVSGMVMNRAKCVSGSTRPVTSQRYMSAAAQACQRCASRKPLFSPYMRSILFPVMLLTPPSLSVVACDEVAKKVRLPRQRLFPGP